MPVLPRHKKGYSLMAILREISVNYTFTEIDCDFTGKAMNSPELVYKVFNFLKFEPKEKFIVVNLNNQYNIMNYEVVATGTVSSVQLRTVEILRTAIVCNSPAVVLIHNHPSGISEPSQADIRFTQTIIKAASTLNIEVLDHVIIGERGFCSLKREGHM
jgi:DNA repair protein RadC